MLFVRKTLNKQRSTASYFSTRNDDDTDDFDDYKKKVSAALERKEAFQNVS